MHVNLIYSKLIYVVNTLYMDKGREWSHVVLIIMPGLNMTTQEYVAESIFKILSAGTAALSE